MTPFTALGGFTAVLLLTGGAMAQLTCSQVTTSGPAVREFGSAYDSVRGRALLFGGDNAGFLRNDTWEWDGAAWSMVTTPIVGPRARPAMAFDEGAATTLMFGGTSPSGIFLNDTWTYDGAQWQSQQPAQSPSARSGTAMVYDPVRQVVVLFGGFVSLGIDSYDTWEWDGATWTYRSSATSPPARGAHRMVYDAGRGTVVMFGGYSTPNNVTLGDTWEWDGSDWSQVASTNAPPTRCDQVLVYDEERGRTVMFGGTASFSGVQPVTLDDCWALESTGWESKTVNGLPSTRGHMLGVYDRANNKTVMHGGVDGSAVYQETFSMQAAQPALMTPYGAGCAGSLGVPVLAADSVPWLGDAYQVSVTNIPAVTVGFLAMGLSDTTWNRVPLPLDLGAFGMPGCQAWLGPELSVTFLVQNGIGSWGTSVCTCYPLVGMSFSLQAIVLDPAVSRPLAASVTNALRATIGDW